MQSAIAKLSLLLFALSLLALAASLLLVLAGTWPIALLLAAAGAVGLAGSAALATVRHVRSKPTGRCPKCRYDLRATPPRNPCPECGYHQAAEILAYRLPFWHHLLPWWVAYPPLIALVGVVLYVCFGEGRIALRHAMAPVAALIASIVIAFLLSLRRQDEPS